ncbi:DUF6879 family protein [Nocardia terpenica]|uniref:DUF6879 domain-containing protein n=1 Tax=Nocardia terpenica TaxID=455432 RepID=A0A161WP58_9NOCA|nr:DUF6879 family protein [Nocardia terpenica]KZM74915.1 hypothetical protein AWN90_23145 [Nocardia terpenica]NQE93426.1 hypothetical protein [Nocardia terpenica]
MQLLPRDSSLWVDLFRDCKNDAFHLETKDSYGVPEESDRIRRFLEGLPPLPDSYKNSWTELIRESTSRGVSVSRVRVVTVPHSDYQRWLLSVTGSNVAAGEDIRYAPRHVAGDVPTDDWWLMDNQLVAYNLVDGAGAPAGLAVTTDPGIVAYCRSVRERLWELAIPYADYVRGEPIQQ